MEYALTFLEGIITFISPCLLPMLPIYLTFLAGSAGSDKNKNAVKNSFGFVLGFTIVFVLLGAAAATFGGFIQDHMRAFNITGGVIVIILGINFAGIFNFPLLNRTKKLDVKIDVNNFFTAVLFGVIFSIGWTPCIGTFLGSALMLAANSKTYTKGVLLLLAYSAGMGIPFVVSALFVDKLHSAFSFIKKKYNVITLISGLFLIVMGIFMITGHFNKFLSFFR